MEVFTEEAQKGEDDLSKYMLDDLQLAAELGKTLLERNKELENLLKEHKNIVEDQAQEIVFLKKHTTALREVNDSRLKVYEQLEVGIQDLERTNHRLLVENTSDKKHIKTLLHNVETLEARSDELNKQLDDTRQALSTERRKNERLMEEKNGANGAGANARLRPTDSQQSAGNGGDNASEAGFDANTTAPENCSFAFQSPGQRNSTGVSGSSASGGGMLNSSGLDMSIVDAVGEDNEEIIKLVNDLETTKKAFLAEQQRCGELEEQLVAIIQENQTLQGRLAQSSTNEEMRSMHDELSILDEVRQGQMCSRCLRAVEDRATVNDEQSSIAPTEEGEEDDERSLLGLDSNRDDNASELSQAAYRGSGGSVSIKADKSQSQSNSQSKSKLKAQTKATTCPICSNATTKYLHEQLPISLESVLLEVWQKTMRKFKLLRWIAKILQWPAIVLCRMISSIPEEEDYALVF